MNGSRLDNFIPSVQLILFLHNAVQYFGFHMASDERFGSFLVDINLKVQLVIQFLFRQTVEHPILE